MEQEPWTEMTENQTWILLKGMWNFVIPIVYLYLSFSFLLEMREMF